MALLSMGGVPDRHTYLSRLPADLNWHLVIAGADTHSSAHPNVHLLPTHSGFFHPDLMAAANAIIGKAGYSTVAEAHHCGVPFGFINRPGSPESAILEAYIERNLPSKAIPPAAYASGEWIAMVPELFELCRKEHEKGNGADEVASYIARLPA